MVTRSALHLPFVELSATGCSFLSLVVRVLARVNSGANVSLVLWFLRAIPSIPVKKHLQSV